MRGFNETHNLRAYVSFTWVKQDMKKKLTIFQRDKKIEYNNFNVTVGITGVSVHH